MKRQVIGIAGGTGSGKSTLADALAQVLDANVIRIDDYYRPLDHLTFEQRELVNFDAPDAIDHQFLIEQVTLLQHGNSINKPVYDFTKHTQSLSGEIIEPKSAVIVEGLFALYWDRLNALYSDSIFVETERSIRFQRRLKRDIEERGRDREEVTHRFNHHVDPMHEIYVAPTACKAKLIVRGDEHFGDELAFVMNHLESARISLR
ncbi:MAG TPA: uridine kinase [Fimbriimonas sp.]|nr:uridine kinase [Fimbriimonas sp.]